MTNKPSGICIAKAKCPDCGSSDGVQIFEQTDGRKDAFCFACEKKFNKVDNLEVSNLEKKPYVSKIKMEHIAPLKSVGVRGIRKEIMELFGVKVGMDKSDRTKVAHHFYPNYDQKAQLQGYNHRICEGKDFSQPVGEVKNAIMFGQQFCPSNRKLFITEGQLDAMSLYQVLLDGRNPQAVKDNRIPCVVSITTGVTGAVNQLNSEAVQKFLSNFKEIILVFDNDDAGRAGAEKVAQSLNHKVLIADYPLKDANEMLLADKGRELFEACLFNARAYEPDGIMNGKDCWERYKQKKDIKCIQFPEQFRVLNDKTFGWRKGEVVTITSGSGMGKTQFCRELKYDIAVNKGMKIADVALEEDIGDSVEGLMALHLNKRIHLPDVEVDEESERKAFEEVFGHGRIELYDHFGGMNDDNLLNKLRYFGTYLKCDAIILDHLSIVISETADEGDERRRIDAVMTKLAVMAKSLDIVIFLVVHLRKAGQGKSFEEGYVPTSDDLRGSASIKQLSSTIIAAARNQQEKDERKRNTTSLHVLKCRFSGDTGESGFTFFDPITGRMVHADDPYAEDEEDEFDDAGSEF